jgi:tetratricopeptide (TPR) repeat protein
MSRTLKYKLLYLLALISTLAVVVIACVYLGLSAVGFLAAALLLFVPGRIGAYFLRDLFLSRRYLDTERYETAIAASERFLLSLDRQPWRQHFIYCFFGIYTWSTRAMALSNIGAAEMELGRIDAAETHLGQALALDKAYPIPYYNLAVIAAVREDHEGSDRMMSKARQLGYSRSAIDQAITRVGTAYARIQSIPN